MADLVAGREAELAALDRALTDKADVIVLFGEPGIGKTMLLGELARRARARRIAVFAGRASEFESNLPLGVFVDALDSHLSRMPPGSLRSLGGDWLDELSAVFPALSRLGSGRGATLPEERFRTVYAIRALLEHLAGDRPVLLALDDAHWADPASLEAIMHLARRGPGPGVALALALRPAHAPPRIVRGLSTLATTLVSLAPLTRAEAAPLLAGVERVEQDAVYQESGGNPFYLTELTRLVATGHRTRGGDLPQRVALALADEIEGLSAVGRSLAKAAAAVADRFDVDILSTASGLPESEVLPGIDELVGRDLIRTTEVASEFRFRHPLVRSAVYELAEPGWRLATHRRIAAWLTARSAPANVIAPHVERSASPGDEKAAVLLKAAGEATHVRAPAIAAHWYEAALRLLPEDQHSELLVPLASSLRAAGQLAKSIQVSERALRLLPAEAGSGWVELTAHCAAAEHLVGRHTQASERLQRALRSVVDENSAEAVALQSQLSADAWYSSQYEQTAVHGLRALRAARVVRDPRLVVTAASLVAFGHVCCGRSHDAEPFLNEAASLFDAMDDRQVAGNLQASIYLAWAEGEAGRFPAAIRHLERGLAIERDTGVGNMYHLTTVGLARALGETGRLTEAIEYARHAADSARLTGNPQGLASALGLLAWLTAQVGDLPAAFAAGADAVRLRQETGSNTISKGVGLMVAYVALEAGDPQRCKELILTECDGYRFPRGQVACFEALARAELMLDNSAEAVRWVERAEVLAATTQLRMVHAHAFRARAVVMLAAGDPAASTAALQAAGAAEEFGAPVYAARARLLAGRALARSDRDHAVEELSRAEATFEACGARRWQAEAASALRSLGFRTPARRQPANSTPYGLSARERDVAVLLVQSKTNKQIATQLFIGVRTVETHVARIFAKIGVRSRAAAALALIRANLAP